MPIKITVDFRDEKKLENLIKYVESDRLYFEVQNLVNELADKAVEDMQYVISSGKKRHSFGSNLEDSITKEIINDVGEIDIGIGNINKLNTDAPYWEVLNNGGYIPYSTAKGAPLGSFEGWPPEAQGGTQNWERSGDKGFFMKPKSPIEGLDYIGKAVRNLDAELLRSIEILAKDYIKKMGV